MSAGSRPRSRDLAAISPVPVDLRVLKGRVAPAAELAIYFTVAEALTNVAKHARATVVDVEVDVEGDALMARVADNGVGGARAAAGSGLPGLSDRLNAIGGTLAVESSPGQGDDHPCSHPVAPPRRAGWEAPVTTRVAKDSEDRSGRRGRPQGLYGSVVLAPASVLPSGGTTSLLLEREAQVAALEALADAARSGGGRLVVIEGSAGIGKTRLLAEARAIAGGAGMRVLAARGGEFEGEFAYGIVRQLFEPLLASASADLREELLSGPAALVEPLVGVSRPAASEDAARRGLVRDPARPLLARRQCRLPPADAARDRRPVLGGHPFPALAPLPDAEARGSTSPRRRGDAAARGRGP